MKFGELLKEWRGRRRLSQLDLAYDAEISPKHLSFIETGRSQPSRDMVLRLAEQLEIPLRERNVLLASAGFAPVFPERTLDDDAMTAVRAAVDVILAGHEPNPAIAIDRRWTLHAMNKAAELLTKMVDPLLVEPPVNVLRFCLHPNGLAKHIANYFEWRHFLIAHLDRQVELTGDHVLSALVEELREYPPPRGAIRPRENAEIKHNIAVPLKLSTDFGELSFMSVTTVFGTPIEITLEELAIESFFPTDAFTTEFLKQASMK
ncbi:MAG: helix-turn-helix domain-containing protein [Blastocatellia bacterium]